jgi:lipoprotein-releasing system permease protein
MKYYIGFAWRNLWRNKRRTLIAMSSIFFAVILALFMRSMQYGSYDYMVKTSVSLYTGYLQIQGEGYWDNRSFDESFVPTASLMKLLQDHSQIKISNPRIESVALISHGAETRISPITGINPESENAMTGLKKRVTNGNYLSDTSKGIIISDGLADRLRVNVGDSLIVYGQGYQGATAAEILPIEGILHFPIPKLNNAMAFVSLQKAQMLFNAYDRVTSIALMIDDANNVSSIQSDLVKKLEHGLIVMNWEEMTPELVQAIEADNSSGMLMLIILYVVIGFGVFGTVMMMTIERTREFGLLIALGMTRTKLLLVSTIETIFVSMIGAIAGMIGAFPIILYFYFNPIPLSGDMAKAMLAWGLEPIMPVMLDASIFTAQTIVVFIIALITSLYPLLFLRKIKPVSAMQGRGGIK